MRRILEILRLHFEQHLSGRAIALAVQCALSSVQECLRRFVASGLSWPVTLDEAALEHALYPPSETRQRAVVDYSSVVTRLRSFKGMTRERVWQEYREREPDGLGYSAFCAGLVAFLQQQKLSARQFHAPGSVMFVDYAGPPLFLTDRRTGLQHPVRVFVATLGYSAAVFAWATPGETTQDWLLGQSLALEYFGGVPERVVPDNPKALVQKPCRYDPQLNPAYAEWAQHYGCAVVPARVRKPQDKAPVEQSVQLLERWAYPELMAQSFFELADLNAALMQHVDAANRRPFQKREGSRLQALMEDRLVLKALPITRHSYGCWSRAKVPPDYHVAVDHRCYSVPYRWVGKTVDIRSSASVVEIFHRGKRLASHALLARRGESATLSEHQPKQHQPLSNQPLLTQAERIGPATAAAVQAQLESRRHPEQVQRAMLGILRLANDYGEAALEAACAQARRLGTLRYRALVSLLKLAQVPACEPMPAPSGTHEHIRGATYFGVMPCTTH